MTSSPRINPSHATPSVAPATPKTASNGGADDFAAKLTEARGSSKPASANSAPAAKASAAPEATAAAEDTQPKNTEAASAPKSAKHPRSPRDPKEKSSDDEDTAASSGQAALAATVNGAQAAATSTGDAVAQSSAAIDSDTGLAIADAANGGKGAHRDAGASVAGSEASALIAGVAGQASASAVNAHGDRGGERGVDRGAANLLPGGRLVAAAGELSSNVEQRVDQAADQKALAVLTDALQGTVSGAADGNTTNAPSLQNATPDTTTSAALSQLSSQLNSLASDPSSLVRNAHSVPQHSLHTPLGARGWSDELATRLTWMVDKHQDAATLRLSPENMGPVEVRIGVRENQVSVWFGAAQADTRAAIESALPRLRELLQGQGLSLADAGVFQQSQRDSSRNLHTPQPGTAFSEAEGATDVGVALRVGLFDGYA